MTPLEIYHSDIAQGQVKFDPAQLDVINKLQQLYLQFATHHQPRTSYFAILKSKAKRYKLPQLKGLYVWGGVGIGKTYLMDIFFQALSFKQKRRVHFHQFMLEVHQQLRECQGRAGPLQLVTHNLAKQFRVLCLDEFIVEDIADAMLLTGLLQGLFAQNVCLVITSNTQPTELYRHGLQRSRFLPAIALLQHHLDVIHLASVVDYRLQTFEQRGVYFTPLNETARQALEMYFQQFSRHENCHTEPITIAGRTIPIVKRSHNILWLSFDVICNPPRSQVDYLEIAENYSLVILSDVPQLNDDRLSQVSYFIKLIDVFYDQQIKLIVSAEVAVTELYLQGKFHKEFQRTQSRLSEMQTQRYWLVESDR